MMVDALHNGDFLLRETTPTPSLSVAQEKEPPSDRKPSSSDSEVFYDTDLSPTPPAEADFSGGLDSPANSMSGDAREGKQQSSSMSDQTRANPRRSPRSSSTSHHRPKIVRPPPSSSVPYGFSPQENVHNPPTPSRFPAPSPHYPAAPLPYDQRTGFRHYPMSAQPPMSMDHTPPVPYTYPHPYSHPGLPDSNMVSQNIHASYQPMLQPQYHPPDTAAPAHPFSAPGPSSMYPHHSTTSPPVHSPPPTSSASPSGGYVGTTTYPSLHYPATPQYAYPHPHSFSTPPPMYPSQYPPMYPSQDAPSHYSQHFPGSPDAERQGTWYYLPHTGSVSPQQYETAYQSHYPMPYSTNHHDMHSYASGTPASPAPSSAYPMSPPLQPTSPPHPIPTSPPIPAAAPPQIDPGGRPPPAEKPIVRRSYHPNPPAHRSEWVMWAGNVPSDATHDELWRFFNQPSPNAPGDEPTTSGVLSIFLISRSSCAFVNFESEHHLLQAIERFNNQSLRPHDSRCPRLVCRVRKKDDDLKAGVGGQRGIGIHTKWIKDQKGKGVASSDTSDVSTDDRRSTASSDQLAGVMSQLSVSSDEESRQKHATQHSGSSGSYTSTNSSLLTRYFPQRYFILKSLTQFDLDLSVEKGLWATQKHNEGILDQAYRTSQDVFLIFSVNKSGEFYGYARMAGPIRHGEHSVSWATRTTDSAPSSRSSLSPVTSRASVHSPPGNAEEGSPGSGRVPQLKGQGKNFFSPSPGPSRLVDKSPLPILSSDTQRNEPSNYLAHEAESLPVVPGIKVQSAPAELGVGRQKVAQVPIIKHSLDTQIFQGHTPGAADDDDFRLDPEAPIRAMRSSDSGDSPEKQSTGTGTGTSSSRGMSLLQAVAEEEEKAENEPFEGTPKVPADETEGVDEGAAEAAREEAWGESFKIEWHCTEKLPFHRTRHIRNPWNHDREVKVSRDGTELEPTVGRRLLEEWSRLAEAQSPAVPPGKGGGQAKRGGKSSAAKETADAPGGAGG
ncbi:hypothetical protein Hypma_016408 [Hypsizygus marmoreus]|uniref:YTH domain-containing protein n=1 Tax=Hypsizygus marmoreus TaxID=39966 RepID=A0A369IZJ8_HYPMA|nr:hypothetical protein Hypma_016408 [Hypsizygus marmoreus]